MVSSPSLEITHASPTHAQYGTADAGAAGSDNAAPVALACHNGFMTTRERLHRLVDNMDDDQVERALLAVEPILQSPGPTAAAHRSLPAFVGSFESGRHDLSQRVDELLADGFGR
jgi:hypothetical protein